MENEFVPYEIAFELKELGFNEPCCARYYYEIEDNKLRVFQPNYARDFNSVTINLTGQKNNDKPLFISVPTFSQVFRWFREKHDLNFYIQFRDKNTFKIVFEELNQRPNFFCNKFKSYEKAELECLKKLIKIVKNK